MKKVKIIAVMLILSILPCTISGCNNSDGNEISRMNSKSSENSVDNSQLTEYSGMVYFDYVDTAFYNVIDAAPAINIDVLTGSFDEDDVYIFCDLDYSKYPETEWDTNDNVLTLSTNFHDIIVKIREFRGPYRYYSIQNSLWVPKLDFDVVEAEIPVSFQLHRNDDAPLAATQEDFKVMFSNNTISAEQLATNFSNKTYSEIVNELGSIGLLQYFNFSGHASDSQEIRIMWYCPDEQKILTLRFDAVNQKLIGREISNTKGEILESDIRMTTAELNDVKARALAAAQEMEQAALEEEKQKLAQVNANRDMNDADLSQISVGDVVNFGSYPFENKWYLYDRYADLQYICDSVYDEQTKSYDENNLISRYIGAICGIDSYGKYPNSFEYMVDDDYPYKDVYYRFQKEHVYTINAIGDDEKLREAYNYLVNAYSDDNGCYYSSIYPTYDDYIKVFNEDVEVLCSNCPNRQFESYDDFKKVFEDRVGENLTSSYQTVKWDVLAIEDGKALLLSHDVIFKKPFFFDLDGDNYSYEDSELRVVLNGDLYDTMFNDREKSKIVETNLPNSDGTDFLINYRKHDYSNGQTVPSKCQYENTKDKLFLLSYDEIEKYYGDFEFIDGIETLFSKNSGYGRHELTCMEVNTEDAGFWWLRNVNHGSYLCVLVVDQAGVIINARTDKGEIAGIRPAMWVSID